MLVSGQVRVCVCEMIVRQKFVATNANTWGGDIAGGEPLGPGSEFAETTIGQISIHAINSFDIRLSRVHTPRAKNKTPLLNGGAGTVRGCGCGIVYGHR